MAREVVIDGVTYRPVIETTADWVLVRSAQAGVFAGQLVSREGDIVVLNNARRIWYWDGAATLSQLALEGTNKPGTCKFPPAVPTITVLGVCEIIPMTDVARESISAVKEWKQ